jgi:DNA-binding IclR family transcriptional regulator
MMKARSMPPAPTHNPPADAGETGSKAPAIARAAAILRLLGKSDVPLGVNAIARELGLVPSTCLYVLRALAQEELVGFDPATKRYALEAGVLMLARGWLRRNRFVDLAQPLLDRIARDHGVTTMGVQVVGLEHMIVTCTALGGASFQLSAQVGSRFPALISATGRLIAAFGGHDAGVLRRRFDALRWDDPPSFEAWMEQVAETRARGWAMDEGNYMAGVTVLAAPVRQPPHPPGHALVAVGLGSAMRKAGVETLAEALAEAGWALAGQMGQAR